MADQSTIDAANAAFWNELCGSEMARQIGLSDQSADSLRRFDEQLFRFYPHLDKYIPWNTFRGSRVLDVGLGYGHLAQRFAQAGAIYTGIDIAAGPVAMVRHRFALAGLTGDVRQASILAPPFEPESFDAVVAIGSLHHSGDLAAAIAVCRRLLKPGGRFIGMGYYAYSYRRLLKDPMGLLRLATSEARGERKTIWQRDTFAEDHSIDGSSAPATEFVSIRSLRALCAGFNDFEAHLENWNGVSLPFGIYSLTRRAILATPMPSLCGLDIYWSCTRSSD